MKNYLTLVLALSVVSSPAFASRARLESLGEGKNGSYYIDDSRNMFLNPASIVRYKKKMMLELGNNNTDALVDGVSAANSRPQGGFTNTFGDFTYALYLNNTSDRAIGTLGSIGAAVAPSDAIEFAFAGEGSVTWGVSVLHGGNRRGADYSRYWAARFGVEKDAFALFGTIGIDSKASNATSLLTGSSTAIDVKGNTNIDLGATYKMDNMTLYGKYITTKATWTAAGTTANEGKTNVFGIGAGWKKEMTKSTNMFARVEANSAKTENSNQANIAAVNNLNVSAWNVPVVLAAETQALSWLAVRGSISHSLLGQNLLNQTDLANSSTVSAGIGMTFGDLVIDGMVATGATAAAFNTTENIGFGTGANSGNNFGFGDNMISRIGLTYNF
ncbi:MAG: hypothetical protein KGP28_07160 [Bdellovibrionales bacterium]|nr:hypothetical protein [Bdellovibrionales bacterium]